MVFTLRFTIGTLLFFLSLSLSQAQNQTTSNVTDNTRPAKHQKSIDIEKYVSKDFHDKNNPYVIPASDSDKYQVPDFEYDSPTHRTFDFNGDLTTPKTNYFDHKFQATVDSVDQTLEHIDHSSQETLETETKDLNLDKLYEETKKNDSDAGLSYVNYKNIMTNDSNGRNALHQDTTVVDGTNLKFRSSYNHTVIDDEDNEDDDDNNNNNTIAKEPDSSTLSNLIKTDLDNAESSISLLTTHIVKLNGTESTIKPLLTTAKNLVLTKPPSNRNSSDSSILSNKIETETEKAKQKDEHLLEQPPKSINTSNVTTTTTTESVTIPISTTEEVTTSTESAETTTIENTTAEVETTSTIKTDTSTTVEAETMTSVIIETSTSPWERSTTETTTVTTEVASTIIPEVVPTTVDDKMETTTLLINPTTEAIETTTKFSEEVTLSTYLSDSPVPTTEINLTTEVDSRTEKKIIFETTPSVERKLQTGFASDFDNSTDGVTSEYYDEPEDNSGTIAAIVISSVGAVCLVLLAGLLVIMRKRQKRFNYGQRCRPVSLDDYSMDNASVQNSVRRKGGARMSKRSYGNPAFDDPASISHVLNFSALSLFAINAEEIYAEFGEIPQITARTNEVPDGCDTKNRYANVIPLPETRVFLKMIDNSPNSDYINANYVTGPKNTKGYYIACQAPLQNTVDDFWRMIWEQQCKVILMITHLFENGVEKCVDYLPPSEVLDCHRLFGDYQVTLKKREVKDKYIISILQLKNMVSNSWRDVTHFWYLDWPEKGVPTEANSLIAYLIEARSYMKTSSLDQKNSKLANLSKSEIQPVVVHCSPGTGRTGVLIACDIAIRDFEQTRLVDLPKIVYKIRRDRASAVQTKEQYAFIYKVVNMYATKLTGGVLDSF